MLSDSILVTIRPLCNVDEDDDGFDKQLIPLINGQLMIAHQFGVGPDGFSIQGDSETWQDLLGEHVNEFEAIKLWLGYSVLLLFDPPDNGSVLKSYQDQVQKMEWHLSNKSFLDGAVKDFVPSKTAFYDGIYSKIEEDE